MDCVTVYDVVILVGTVVHWQDNLKQLRTLDKVDNVHVYAFN